MWTAFWRISPMRTNNIRSYFDTVMELFALGLTCFHKRRKHKSQQKRRDVLMGKNTVSNIFSRVY